MEHLYEKASASAAYLKEKLRFAPKVAVVLGSGLGDLTAGFTDTQEIPYADIPSFPQSTSPVSPSPPWQATRGPCWRASWGIPPCWPWKGASISMRATP